MPDPDSSHDTEDARARREKARQKAREGRILGIVFGTIIVVLILLMYFLDEYYQNRLPGNRQIQDAAEQ